MHGAGSSCYEFVSAVVSGVPTAPDKKAEKTGYGNGRFCKKPGISCDYVRLLIY
jgi:hypothetical protein